MRAVRQRVGGELLLQGGKNALILHQLKPPKDAENLVYLRFALVTRGPGDHFFPAFVLDDWGKERRRLGLYQWILESGDQFPRAEIFGFNPDGTETQAFVRAMEHYARFPCYAYAADEATVADEAAVAGGHLLSAILLPDALCSGPKRIKKPEDLKLPLSNARVNWWQIPEEPIDFDLSILDAEPDPGY